MSVSRRALIALSVFVAVAMVAVGIVLTLQHESAPAGTPVASASPVTPGGCPSGLVPADLRLPERREIRLGVLNATGQEGREMAVFVELGQRDFQMLSTTGGLEAVDVTAIIRYGPRTVGAAWVVRAYFSGSVSMEFDIDRTSDQVDIVIGKRFDHLATITEVNQAIARQGQPTAPPGTCAADR